MPIRARMALLGVGVIALTLLLFGVLIYALVSRGIATEQDRTLNRRAEQTLTSLAGAAPEAFRVQPAPVPLNLRENDDVFVMVLDSSGRLLSGSGEVDGDVPTIPAALLTRATEQGSAAATIEPASDVSLRVQVRPWQRPDLGLHGYVITGQSLAHNARQERAIKTFLTASAVISLLVAAAAIWLVLGRALRPLRDVARTADEIARTRDLGRRLPLARTGDEVGSLTASFNGMMARLQEANSRLSETLESQRRFVADASHELRTPVTTIRTNAGYLQQPDIPLEERQAALRDIAAESERMSRLIHDLLTLARADAGRRLEMTCLDLTALAAEVCRQARMLHRTRRIEAAGDEPLIVRGNADALTRMLWILVDNAVKHTPEGGRIRIWSAYRDGAIRLKVADDGTGIAEAELERIFDRFYQADRARGGEGAGLGLAIARRIAEAHGGSLRAYNNDGGGATFLFEQPDAELSSGS